MVSRTVGEFELEGDGDVTLDDEGEGEFELWFSGQVLTTKIDLTHADLVKLRALIDQALG